ncbi:hypothetical protein [Lacticaseibacillus nasuensis]|uniref:hypothetical protein n=1 Tax=Lacticaseibacillus nasuensis TaxID=944671 RepID=UPI0006D23D0F|nr:hypothetical protein [Lacticaseibacillus nasuensis]
MTQRRRAGERREVGGVSEHLTHQTEPAMTPQSVAIEANDAGPFLTTVLQGVQAQVRQSHRVGVAPHAEDAALFI